MLHAENYYKKPADLRIIDCIGCQWTSRLSKINDFLC